MTWISGSTSLSLGLTTATSRVCPRPEHLPEVKCVGSGAMISGFRLQLSHPRALRPWVSHPSLGSSVSSSEKKNGDDGTQLKGTNKHKAWMQLISASYYSASSGPTDKEGSGVVLGLHSRRNPRLPMFGRSSQGLTGPCLHPDICIQLVLSAKPVLLSL